jgi:hypothetical protein
MRSEVEGSVERLGRCVGVFSPPVGGRGGNTEDPVQLHEPRDGIKFGNYSLVCS